MALRQGGCKNEDFQTAPQHLALNVHTGQLNSGTLKSKDVSPNLITSNCSEIYPLNNRNTFFRVVLCVKVRKSGSKWDKMLLFKI